MATVYFLYRSRKPIAFLNLRLLFTHQGKNYTPQGTSKIEVPKDYWDKLHNKKTKDPGLIELQKEIKDKIFDLERYILKQFDIVNPLEADKKWLAGIIDDFYNPKSDTDSIPKDLTNYIDTYIDYRKNDITNSTKQKIKVGQEMIKRFEEYRSRKVYIKDINIILIKEFEKYCSEQGYKHNTTARAIRYIKTVCRHAKTIGLETHPQLDAIKITYKKSQPIYLTPEEIKSIEELTNLAEHLDNVRDWFLISYNTAQRVSDFLNFKKSMIKMHTVNNGEMKPFLEFNQKKTGKRMTIPLTAQVMEILNKRNGEFPRKISDQKYNTFLKDLCREAKITELVWGSKKTETSQGSKQYRHKEDFYEKCDLVSSHVGRYSFATNNYAKNIPTSILSKMTGHATEAMFLNYIGKSGKDMAMEMSNFFQ